MMAEISSAVDDGMGEQIFLPLEAEASGRMLAYAFLLFFMSPIFIFLFYIVFLSPDNIFYATNGAGIGSRIWLGFLGTSGLLIGALSPWGAAIYLRDFLRTEPILVIGTDSIKDARISDTPIRWDEVSYYDWTATKYGPQAIQLYLKKEIRKKWRPLGSWARRRAKRKGLGEDMVGIPIIGMSPRPRTILRVIEQLTARHGIKIRPSWYNKGR